MPEIRVDPVTGHSVIVAPDRLARPGTHFSAADFANTHADAGGQQTCPFCPGQEMQTPPEVATYPRDGRHGEWQVRVVPNRFPAVGPGDVSGTCQPPSTGGKRLYLPPRAAYGTHDVVVETPDHFGHLSSLPIPSVALMLQAYLDRLRQLAAMKEIVFGLAFKNHGTAAGASLDHPHSQIVGLDHVPSAMQLELSRSAEFHERTNDCLFCRMIEQELALGVRLVEFTDEFVMFCPYASRFPYEMWLLPRLHQADFCCQNAAGLGSMAQMLQRNLRNLEKLSQNVPYNYLIHSAPFDIDVGEHYHWHMEVLPRLARVAGFEWGSGCYLNPVPPEQAAQQLRAVNANRH